MYKDVDKADSIITRLADLLRYSLASKQHPFVPLHQELDAMKSYLEIAQLRFGERLVTDLQISPSTLPVMIPVMLLQPLLENAVKHGIEPSDCGGSIVLKTIIEDDYLVITIINSFNSLKRENTSFGIGLENTRKRLEYIYQQKQSLEMKTIEGNKMSLQIKIPIEQIYDRK